MFGNIIETRRTGFSVNTGDNGQFFNNQIVNNAKAATSIGGTPAVFRTNFAALGVTMLLSVVLAATIAEPVRRLAESAEQQNTLANRVMSAAKVLRFEQRR